MDTSEKLWELVEETYEIGSISMKERVIDLYKNAYVKIKAERDMGINMDSALEWLYKASDSFLIERYVDALNYIMKAECEMNKAKQEYSDAVDIVMKVKRCVRDEKMLDSYGQLLTNLHDFIDTGRFSTVMENCEHIEVTIERKKKCDGS